MFKGDFDELSRINELPRDERQAALAAVADTFSKSRVISGHSGAVYVIRDTDKRSIPVIGQQANFHDVLREIWRSNKAPKKFGEALMKKALALVWNGKLDKSWQKDLLTMEVPFVDSKGERFLYEDTSWEGFELKPVENLEQLAAYQKQNFKSLKETLSGLVSSL